MTDVAFRGKCKLVDINLFIKQLPSSGAIKQSFLEHFNISKQLAGSGENDILTTFFKRQQFITRIMATEEKKSNLFKFLKKK